MRPAALALLAALAAAVGWGEDAGPPRMDAAQRAAFEKRYGPLFYGVELPRTGARVLLVADVSKSMALRDGSRKDGGRRWDTLIDEVAQMAETMGRLSEGGRVCYTVSVLYEGGDERHGGTEPFDLARPGEAERLLGELRGRGFVSGGSFDHTFGETLWPLVARQHITHIFYLGDDDIGRYGAEPARKAVSAWYALPRKDPAPDQRALWETKVAWWKPWGQRRRAARGAPAFREALRLPPPPRDVVFSCVAIGQPSELLRELAGLGRGEYVERLSGRRRAKE